MNMIGANDVYSRRQSADAASFVIPPGDHADSRTLNIGVLGGRHISPMQAGRIRNDAVPISNGVISLTRSRSELRRVLRGGGVKSGSIPTHVNLVDRLYPTLNAYQKKKNMATRNR